MKLLFTIITVCASLHARGEEILVSAAASLTNVLPVVAAEFKRGHPDARVKFNFGGSGALRLQIERGAPADLFISAAPNFIDSLQAHGAIVATTRRTICGDELVLIAPVGSTLANWNGLAGASVKRIAIGDPASVPAGMYTKQALRTMQLWDGLAGKFLLTENVRQALRYVDGGNVDAGVVYRTDARIATHTVTIAAAPAGSHDPIAYVGAVVARSSHRGLAEAFLNFLATDAQPILKSHGFTLPAGPQRQ